MIQTLKCICFKITGAVIFGYGATANKMMGNCREFFFRRGSSCNFGFAVNLPGVGRDDFGIEISGELNADSCFAYSGRADNYNQKPIIFVVFQKSSRSLS